MANRDRLLHSKCTKYVRGLYLPLSVVMQNGYFPGNLNKFMLTLTVLMLGHGVHCNPVRAQSTPTDRESFQSPPVEPRLPELPASTDTNFWVGDTYILGVGDYLQVDVFNIPDYSGEFRVLSGGTLNIPVVGLVAVEGLSLQQAATLIEKSLEPYVRRPNVTLSVLGSRPIQIAIAGEVHRPGTYRVTAGDNSSGASATIPTLTQAIELADGITQLADIRQIEIKRRLPAVSNVTQSRNALLSDAGRKQAQFQTISVNLWDLLKEGNLSEDLALQDGDRIIIPTADTLSYDEATELATASFSPDQISINVVGEVGSPGNINVPPNIPLNQAILAAGGFNDRAQTGTVSLVRLNPDGTASQRDIEVDFTQGINEDLNPSLRPNDTVIVRRSGLTRASDTVRTIFAPFNLGLNILRLFGL